MSAVGPETVLLIGFFFFNSFLLPAGLLYTTLLTPLFFLLIIRRRRWRFFIWYLVLTGGLAYLHAKAGADMAIYLRSYLLFTSAVIFVLWVYYFVREHPDRLGRYFQQIALYNSLFAVLALLLLFVPVLRELFWSFVPIHPAVPVTPRLKMLVYEPSFYSLQLAPVFLFYFTAYVFSPGNRYLPGLLAVGFSLILSLSFGVLGGLSIAIAVIILFHLPRLLARRKIFFLSLLGLMIGGMAVYIVMQYFPFNPVVERLDKLAEGNDPSARGRTWEAFLLSWRIAEKTSYLFGAGIGQIKEAGHQIIVEYYNYEGDWAELVRIPNTMAETLATFGLVGAVGRVVVQIGLFFYTKVYENYYRLFLFTFIFIYQFTGSYLTNIYEYAMWVVVFLPVFPQFDKRNVHAGSIVK